MRGGDERVHEQLQRLLAARDKQAFSRLLIDSVCSMPADDFRRVREKLIRKFVDERRRASGDGSLDGGVWTDKTAVKTESSIADDRTASEEDVATLPHDDDAAAAAAALPLKIVNVRSCSVDDQTSDGAWTVRPGADDRPPPVKHEPLLDSSPCDGGHFTEDDTTTGRVTTAPIEATTDSDGERAIEPRDDDDLVQRPHADLQPAPATCRRELGQVYSG